MGDALLPSRARRVLSDWRVMDNIGAMLSAPEWDIEMLDGIAHLVASTGRPHPGEPKLIDGELDAIEMSGRDINAAAREAYEKCLGPVRVGSDQSAPEPDPMLYSVATMMVEHREWDSEMLEWIADKVGRSGRPHPGGEHLSDAELDAAEQAGEDPDDAGK